MKAICSFILALAVSSAGAQIRPVESLPIAVNYSKTIHLVFPSAVKYNQAVTDFVAVDNPESVPNILRIKFQQADDRQRGDRGRFFLFV